MRTIMSLYALRISSCALVLLVLALSVINAQYADPKPKDGLGVNQLRTSSEPAISADWLLGGRRATDRFMRPTSALTAGNLLVCRVGSGAGPLGNRATAAFLDEYTTSGVLVQSLPLPTTESGTAHPLTLSGIVLNECQISRSDDGRYVVVPGYDSAVDETLSGAQTLARVGSDGVIDTTTTLIPGPTSVFGATSTDGSGFWIAGSSIGVMYTPFGASGAATTVTSTTQNLRAIKLFDGQLYVAGNGTNFKGVNKVGVGASTDSGQTLSRLPGMTDSSNPNTVNFFFADLSSSVSGPDTLYIADSGAGGLAKYSLDSGTWTSNGKIGSAADAYRGLAGTVTAGSVTLYATRRVTSSSSPGEIVSVTDATGYNTTLAATVNVLAVGQANSVFRGIALAPAASPGALQFASPAIATDESAESALAGVMRAGGTDGVVSAQYALSDGTAVGGASCAEGVDFINSGGFVTFPNGAASASISVPICNDSVVEGAETFRIDLSAPLGGATIGSPSFSTVTINDDDVPSIQLDAASYAEDESEVVNVVVRRTSAGNISSSVSYATSSITALGGSACGGSADYVSASGTLTFAPADVSKSIPIQLCSDVRRQPLETFRLTLSNPVAAVLGAPRLADISIRDAAATFRNSAPITIPGGGPADIYPSTISVGAASGQVGAMRVTLFDLTVTTPENLNLLLVGPDGQKFVLMAAAGGSFELASPTSITFSDRASARLPDNAAFTSGEFRPANWESTLFSFPGAPPGPYLEPGPAGTPPGSQTFTSAFAGTSISGQWKLYVYDETASPLQFSSPGAIAGGWGIEFISPTAAAASLSGRVTGFNGNGIANAVVTISGPALPQSLRAATGPFGYYRFDGLVAGQLYLVSVRSKRYAFRESTRAVSLNDSISDFDFVAEPVGARWSNATRVGLKTETTLKLLAYCQSPWP